MTPETAAVIASLFLGSAGQVLFKLGMRGATGVWSALVSPSVLLGLTCYALSTLFWLRALARVPLTLAYPLLSLNFITVPILSHLFLREPIPSGLVAGTALIIAGVWALFRF